MRDRLILGMLKAAWLAVPASAMNRYGSVVPGAHLAVADPDTALDQLADASASADHGHAKPTKSARDILRNDPYPRSAFAWLDHR